MPTTPLVLPPVIAYHGTEGGDANPLILVVFLGVAATAGWLFFSPMSFRSTVIVTVAAWLAVVGLTVTFIL